MIDFGEFPSLSLETPSIVTSNQFVCYLYEKNKLGSSENELRQRMFTEKFFSGDRLPSTLDALVLHLRRALIFSHEYLIFFSKLVCFLIKNIK